jgi:protein-S-isoprenylcysteine O-methyltransferase Ste14
MLATHINFITKVPDLANEQYSIGVTMTTSNNSRSAQAQPLSYWPLLIITYLIIPLLLMVCAGDFCWWQAWVFSLLILIAGIGGRIGAEKRHPGLMAERVNFKKAADVKAWDKVLSPLMAVSVGFPLVIVAGFDHRFSWSPTFPLWINILGFILITVGYALAVWALVENRFFSSVVRIQTERGHVVCDSGPYQFIRHPGYAGNILPLPGIALALSSVWTLIPAAVALTIAVIRTSLEDQTLLEELPGYKDYARRVRYRLFPGIF